MSVRKILFKKFGWLFLFTIAVNVTLFAAPLHMLLVYDRVLASGSVETLVMLTVLCIGLLLSMSLLTAARQWMLIGKADELDRVLAPALFELSVLSNGKASAGRDKPSSNTSHALSDLASVRQFITSPVMGALLDLPFAPLFFVGLFVIHHDFGVLGLLGAGLIMLLAWLGDVCTRYPLNQAQNVSRTTRDLADSFARDAPAARAMGMGDNILAIWSHMHFSSGTAQSTAAGRAAFISSLTKFTRMALQSITLAVGAWLVLKNEASSGAIIASSIILGRALAPVEIIIGSWKSLVSASGAYARLRGFAAVCENDVAQTDTHTALPAPRGNLIVNNVTHSLSANQEPLLHDLKFSVRPGELLGIVGPSGSGKSTLAQILIGDVSPTQGSVTLDGVEISNWPRAELGPHLGYMPQDVHLMSGTIGENISRFDLCTAGQNKPEINKRILAAAHDAGAHDMIASLPKAYDTQAGDGGRLLSGGQRQRVALARAIYGNVRFVVLDEPNASLDSAGEHALIETLKVLKARGVSIIVITHNAALVQLLDRVLILKDGRIVDQGTPAAVFRPRPHTQGPTQTAQPAGRTAVSAPPAGPAPAAPATTAVQNLFHPTTATREAPVAPRSAPLVVPENSVAASGVPQEKTSSASTQTIAADTTSSDVVHAYRSRRSKLVSPPPDKSLGTPR